MHPLPIGRKFKGGRGERWFLLILFCIAAWLMFDPTFHWAFHALGFAYSVNYAVYRIEECFRL